MLRLPHTPAGQQAQTGKAGALTKCHSSLSVSRSSLVASQDLAQCFVGFQDTGNQIQAAWLHRAMGTAGLGSGGWSRRMGALAGTRHMSDLHQQTLALAQCLFPRRSRGGAAPPRSPAQPLQVSLPLGLGQQGLICQQSLRGHSFRTCVLGHRPGLQRLMAPALRGSEHPTTPGPGTQ